jgi:hypothetical protein
MLFAGSVKERCGKRKGKEGKEEGVVTRGMRVLLVFAPG